MVGRNMAKAGAARTAAAEKASAKVNAASAKKLHIVVCIKPVPDPARWEKLKLDPDTLLLNRGELPAVINALDLNAIEQALEMKEAAGQAVTARTRLAGKGAGAHAGKGASPVTVSVVTMAPPAAEEQLREALAMGCDRAYLLSDRAFAGADTLATARCLAAAIRRIADEAGAVQMVFCGAYSADGSTWQVGPQLAELLDMPDLTRVVKLEILGVGSAGGVRAACKVEDGTLIAECDLPVLVTFDREANQPRLPDMPGIRRARDLAITTWTAADLGFEPGEVGLAGSPTQMLNVFQQAQGRKGEILSGTAAEMAGKLIEKLVTEKAIDRGCD